jgi:hypothetical protein
VKHRLIAAAVAAAAAVALAACGADEDGSTERAANTTTEKRPTDIPRLEFVAVNEDGETVRARTVLLTGKVSAGGAAIDANGKTTTATPTGTFRVRVPLELGENTIHLRATKGGHRAGSEAVYVTRENTARELAAIRRRERRERERERAELRANAQAIDPEQLQKDPDKFAGEAIVISGEIFQR